MGKREISILEPAAKSVAEIAWFIEHKGLPQTAKKIVEEMFRLFETLSDERIMHKPCSYKKWKELNYRCASYKKYVIAYLDLQKEIVICEIAPAKMLKKNTRNFFTTAL